MRLRYYLDPATGEPHIYRHNVRENEVEEVVARPIEDRLGREESRIAVGQTEAGRYLRVIYVCRILSRIPRSSSPRTISVQKP